VRICGFRCGAAEARHMIRYVANCRRFGRRTGKSSYRLGPLRVRLISRFSTPFSKEANLGTIDSKAFQGQGGSYFCYMPRQCGRWGLFGLFVLAYISGAYGQEKIAVADSYHVEIRVLKDGSLEVTERLYMSFQGTFRKGSREILLDRMDGIEVLEVGEEGRPYERGHGEEDYTYVVEEGKDYVRVLWYYPKVTDDKRAFYIRYRAIGAVRR
jgi:hypothetical protein